MGVSPGRRNASYMFHVHLFLSQRLDVDEMNAKAQRSPCAVVMNAIDHVWFNVSCFQTPALCTGRCLEPPSRVRAGCRQRCHPNCGCPSHNAQKVSEGQQQRSSLPYHGNSLAKERGERIKGSRQEPPYGNRGTEVQNQEGLERRTGEQLSSTSLHPNGQSQGLKTTCSTTRPGCWSIQKHWSTGGRDLPERGAETTITPPRYRTE